MSEASEDSFQMMLKVNALDEYPIKQREMFFRSLPIRTPPNYSNLTYYSMNPVPEMTLYGMRGLVLEYPNPVKKRACFTEQTDLSTDGLVKDSAETINVFIEQHNKEDYSAFHLQSFPFGGDHSMFHMIGYENPLYRCHSC